MDDGCRGGATGPSGPTPPGDGIEAAAPGRATATPAELALHNNFVESARVMQRGLARTLYYLLAIREGKVYRVMGFDSLAAYAERHAGLSPRTLSEMLTLARRMRRSPRLADAVDSGALSWRKALAISREALDDGPQPLIELAGDLSVRQLRSLLAHGELPPAVEPSSADDALDEPARWAGPGPSDPGPPDDDDGRSGLQGRPSLGDRDLGELDGHRDRRDPDDGRDTGERCGPDGTRDPDGACDPDGTRGPDGTRDPDGTRGPDGTRDPDGAHDPGKATVRGGPEERKSRRRRIVIGGEDSRSPQYVTLKLSPEQFARWEALSARSPDRVEAILTSLEGEKASSAPHFELVILHCPSCRSAALVTSRGELPVPEPLLSRARCDSVSLAEDGSRRATIAPRLRRAALRRARYRCEAQGCSHTRWLELHHRQPVSQQGSDRLDNLVVLCGRCHRRLHEREEKLREIIRNEPGDR